jgi:hypothetical protein
VNSATNHTGATPILPWLLALGFMVSCGEKVPPPQAAKPGTSPEEIALVQADFPLYDLTGADFTTFRQCFPSDSEVEPQAGPKRPDISRQIHQELAALAIPEDSAGYVIFRTDGKFLFLRGEVPDEPSRQRVLSQLRKNYAKWHIDDRLRVDERLAWPEEGLLLTLQSLPSAEIALAKPLVAYTPLGRQWKHCTLLPGQASDFLIQEMDCRENARARLDMVLLLAPVTASNP